MRTTKTESRSRQHGKLDNDGPGRSPGPSPVAGAASGERLDTIARAFAAGGLDRLCEHLERMRRGDAFAPMIAVAIDGETAAFLRALRELAAAAGCDFAALSAAPHEFLGSFAEDALLEKLACDGGTGRRAGLRSLARRLRSVGSASVFENDQATLIHQKEKLQRAELLIDLLTAAGGPRPVVIAVENADRMDPSFRESLLYVGRSIACRQESLRAGESWPRACFVMLGTAALPAEPFVTFLKPHARRGRRLAEAIASLFPPNRLSLAALAGGDLGACTAEERAILAALSVQPRAAAASRLMQATKLGRRAFSRAIAALRDGGVLAVYGPLVEIQSASLAAAVRRNLTADERRARALAWAGCCEKDGGDGTLLAYHLFAAGAQDRAIAAAIAAVERLRARGALNRAEAMLEHLVGRCAGAIAAEKLIALRRDLAEIASVRGDHARAQQLLRANQRVYDERGDAAAAARVRVQLGILAANLEKPAEALEHFEAASAVLAADPRHAPDYLRLQVSLARVLTEKSEYARALAAAEKAVDFLEAHFRNTAPWRRLKAVTLSRLGNTHAALSRFPEALEAYEASAQEFRSFPDSLEKGGFYCNLARLYLTVADYRKAERYFRMTSRIARSLGARELLGLTEINRGVLCLYQWDLAAAEEHLAAGIALSESAGSHRFVRFGRICLGNLRCRQGKFEESLRLFAAEMRSAKRANDRYFYMNACLQAVYPYLERGQWRRAQRAARMGARIASELSWPYGILEGALTQGQVAAALCAWDAADDFRRRAIEAPWGHHGHVDAELAYLEGEILAGRNDLERAADAFRGAGRAFRALDVWVYAARSRLREAEILLRLGQRARAARLCDGAWRSLAALSPEKRPPILWFPATLLRAELRAGDGAGDPARVREVRYEVAEALAQARAIHAIPYLWRLLACLASLCVKLEETEEARRYAREALRAFRDHRASSPVSSRAALRDHPEARRLLDLARDLLGEDAEPVEPAARSQGPGEAVPGAAAAARVEFEGMAGGSPGMTAVYALIERVAPTDLPVLVTGESGTGKELVANAIHRLSARARGPLVFENCGAIPESLAEAELFGYVRGAFTGADDDRPGRIESASGGTLVLDEIGDLPLPIQASLLRVLSSGTVRPLGGLEARPVDVRLVAATSRDLRGDIARGAFRPDLFYRLLGMEIHLPPLRERGADILRLAERFFRAFLPPRAPAPRLTAQARQALLGYAWPGNVRELENEIRRLAVLGGELIELRDLRIGAGRPRCEILPPGVARRHSLADTHAIVEREYLAQAIEECGGVIARVAKFLGMNRRSVYKMMRRLGIEG